MNVQIFIFISFISEEKCLLTSGGFLCKRNCIYILSEMAAFFCFHFQVMCFMSSVWGQYIHLPASEDCPAVSLTNISLLCHSQIFPCYVTNQYFPVSIFLLVTDTYYQYSIFPSSCSRAKGRSNNKRDLIISMQSSLV